MQEYLGQPCMICGKDFHEQDDIVTCPECGTPYHRACYKEIGACINTELHVSGESWVIRRRAEIAAQKAAEKRAEQEAQAAERERGEAPQMINGSLYDGVRLNPNDPCVGLDPNENMDGATMGEVAEFVSTNRFYYLPLFRLMKQTGRRFSFNLICLFCPQFYFANRKMWALTIGSMLLDMLFNIPNMLTYMYEQFDFAVPWADVTTVQFQQMSKVCWVIGFLLSIFWCLFANNLYYRFTVRKIKRIKKASASDTVVRERLHTEGGTSAWNILLALIIQVAFAFAIVNILYLVR